MSSKRRALIRRAQSRIRKNWRKKVPKEFFRNCAFSGFRNFVYLGVFVGTIISPLTVTALGLSRVWCFVPVLMALFGHLVCGLVRTQFCVPEQMLEPKQALEVMFSNEMRRYELELLGPNGLYELKVKELEAFARQIQNDIHKKRMECVHCPASVVGVLERDLDSFIEEAQQDVQRRREIIANYKQRAKEHLEQCRALLSRIQSGLFTPLDATEAQLDAIESLSREERAQTLSRLGAIESELAPDEELSSNLSQQLGAIEQEAEELDKEF